MSRTHRLLAVLLVLLPVAASAGPFYPPTASGVTKLSTNGTIVGTGADTTEDALMQYTIPAGTLVNVGDRVHIYAAGKQGATTDTKSLRVRLGSCSAGTLIVGQNTASAAAVGWVADIVILKTGSNTQSYGATTQFAGTQGVSGGSGTLTQTDTAGILVCFTGQNSTTATLNSVQQQIMTVDYMF